MGLFSRRSPAGSAAPPPSETDAARLIEQGKALPPDRAAEALALFDAALRIVPNLASAHLGRGTALLDLGDLPQALNAYAAATRLDPGNVAAHLNTGMAQLRAGRLDDALAAYRAALAIDPEHVDAHVAAGYVLDATGRAAEAVASYRRALDLRPDYAEVHGNLGSSLRALGRRDEAVESLSRALALKPDLAPLRQALGDTLLELARYNDAAACLHELVDRNPRDAAAWLALGNAHALGDQLDDAVACFQRALEFDPGHANAALNLGEAQKSSGRVDEAIDSYRRALSIRPAFGDAAVGLGIVLQLAGRLPESIASFRHAVAIKPNDARAHALLGNALRLVSELGPSLASLERAVALDAQDAVAHTFLANSLQSAGRIDEALDHYRRALELDPLHWEARSNLLMVMNYSPATRPEDYLAEARRYGSVLDGTIGVPVVRGTFEPSPTRLRVGLVSGDLRNHPVGYFVAGLLAHHDPARVEFRVYATSDLTDKLTSRLRKNVAAWTTLNRMSDNDAARRIHGDGVHVLLDLSGHTANNRLPVFGRRPAPVQASWLGYFASTGVTQMDYLIADRFVVPTGEEGHFSERVWRLPDCYLCFTPPHDAPTVAPLPALTAGRFTFGCFNNLSKLNERVIVLWARVLAAVPGSRLLLKTYQLADAGIRAATAQRFAAAGVTADRLLLEGPSSRADYLAAYGRVDMALDPFPFPGGTTTVEGYWMGVPTLTRRGDRFISHAGETFAHNTGLADWIADDDDAYVAKAAAFATDLDGLAALRAGLRERARVAPTFDAMRYARQFEDALWGMWVDARSRR